MDKHRKTKKKLHVCMEFRHALLDSNCSEALRDAHAITPKLHTVQYRVQQNTAKIQKMNEK